MDSSSGRQLPTRVSNACDRCRRNKSRCDHFRPCSLCTRANVECLTSQGEIPARPAKRKRTSDGNPLQEPLCSTQDLPQSVLLTGEDTTAQTTFPNNHTQEAPIEFDQDAESRRPSVAEGQIDSAMGIAQKIYQLSGQGTPILRRTTSAIPGGDLYRKPAAHRPDRAQKRPISSIIGFPLPSADLMRLLLEEYFDAVHWFSLVIYEPRFRPKYDSVADGMAHTSQKSFLLLLSIVLGMGAWYKSHKKTGDLGHQVEDWRALASSLVGGAGSQLTELMDQASIPSVQACILLGSYYVYHGKPNLSFSLLGATIRTAQAIRLHRQPLRGDTDGIEERKRVWWTIYTWDRQATKEVSFRQEINPIRFASITYGRPLGINEKDCNVSQPDDTYEFPYFSASGSVPDAARICYSGYQRELDNLYVTASPIIEIIFGMRSTRYEDHAVAQHYLARVMDATERLWAWRRRLPPHLLLDLSSDCEASSSRTSKVHRLQALSLQLTFDNLLIIFHRPSLAQQVDHLLRNQPEPGHFSTPSPSNAQGSVSSVSPLFTGSAHSPLSVSQASSTEQWWEAALRTSKVTQMPQLAQLATDSHLVAFLAINLFNSAIVMAVLALSEPLSDRAQEVKRSITRIFRLQELLAKRTELSMQSNVVLKDVIHMLLQREADAMLQPLFNSEADATLDEELSHTASEAPFMSVEDTLRLPMQLPTTLSNARRDHRTQSGIDKVVRLNESLASVQRVLPSAYEGFNVDDVRAIEDQEQAQDAPDQVLDEANLAWFDPDLPGISNGVDWVNEGTCDIAGNGLYWFWDSAWGESRS